MFIKNPNLPENKIKAALIDYRAERTEEALCKLGIKVYKTPKIDVAYSSVCGHPDMLFHHLDSKCAVAAPEAFSYFKTIFKNEKIILGKSTVERTYPLDIAYNVARLDKIAFHNVKYTDSNIIEYYLKNGIKLIDVKQGYSKCSICIVSKDAIITSDKKIAATAKKNNIDVLCIREGYIKLKDFPYGFIGGASGLISGEILVFNGNIRLHPDYNDIVSFCKKHKVEVFSLHEEPLEDIGSIIPLY